MKLNSGLVGAAALVGPLLGAHALNALAKAAAESDRGSAGRGEEEGEDVVPPSSLDSTLEYFLDVFDTAASDAVAEGEAADAGGDAAALAEAGRGREEDATRTKVAGRGEMEAEAEAGEPYGQEAFHVAVASGNDGHGITDPGPRANVAYSVDKLPGHTDADIRVHPEGPAGETFVDDNGNYHVRGAGAILDTRGDPDHFHYYYTSKPQKGDIDVSVHLSALSINGDGTAEAGIMLRSDDGPDAAYAMADVTQGEGYCVRQRFSEGGDGYWGSCHGGSELQSHWLRIVKASQTVYFYRSESGEVGTWVLHHNDTLFFPEDEYRVGLAVMSGKLSTICTALFKNYKIKEYYLPPPVRPHRPPPARRLSPCPVDIGPHTRQGVYTEGGDHTTIRGSGDGIWGQSDDFFFYNRQMANTDQLTVVVQIKTVEDALPYTRGGLMIRESNMVDAANAFAGSAGPAQGTAFQSRSATGGETVHHTAVSPCYRGDDTCWSYAKLEKKGNIITASYYGMNLKGDEYREDGWFELGSTEVMFTGATLQVGVAVAGGGDRQVTMEYKNFDVTVPSA